MTKHLHVKTIETPAEIAQSANGKHAYVKLRTRFKGKVKRILQDVAEAARAVRDMSDALPDDEKTSLALRYLELQEKGLPIVFNEQVVDWNWADDSGEPLPDPKSARVFSDELVEEQTQWILAEIGNILRYRTTEGNPTGGGNSTPG